MKRKLKDIVQLQPGVHVKASKHNVHGDAFFVSLRDFDGDLSYLKTSPKIETNDVKKKYIVSENDLLFSTRLKFNAFLLPESSQSKYVASNSFAIIKPNITRVLPEYLYWFLNHPNTQIKLIHLSQGQSRVPYINLKKLETLEIELPKMEVQQEISTVYKLHQKEKQLTQKLIQKKEEYIQTALLKTITHE